MTLKTYAKQREGQTHQEFCVEDGTTDRQSDIERVVDHKEEQFLFVT